MSHLPLRVMLNLTDHKYSKNVEILRAQVTSAGAVFADYRDLSALEFLDLVTVGVSQGSVAVIDQGLVTGQAMIDALVKGQSSASAALVKPIDKTSTVSRVKSSTDARVIHKRIVSAATTQHSVTKPTHIMLGFVRIGDIGDIGDIGNTDKISNDVNSHAALQQTRDYYLREHHSSAAGAVNSSEVNATEVNATEVNATEVNATEVNATEVNVGDLITVALVRAGCPVVAIAITGVCERVGLFDELASESLLILQQEVAAQDEAQIRTKRALRADDGFYSSFVLRKLSRKVSMFAVKRGWTPNQLTVASLILALVVSGFFATGWLPLMIVGAIGVQVSLIIDCSDGEVARYTGVSSQRGAWLDAATDRIKEYALYAGLAFGASHHGVNLWPLAMTVMVLQTIRHMSDYNFNAVQVLRESAVLPFPLTNRGDDGVVSNGTLLDTSAQLNSNSKVRWVKKVIHFPIGERWLVISLGALFNAPAAALWALLIFGLIGLGYTTVGRVLRSKSWRHSISVSGSEVLARQIYPGLGVDWLWANSSLPLGNRFAWSVPAILRLLELGFVLAVAHKYPIAYLWIFAVAFHHYDALYRSLAGFEIPAIIKAQGLGFLGRSLIILLTAIGFVIPLETTLLIGGIGFTSLFVGYASKQWMQQLN